MFVISGPTEQIRDYLFGAQQQNEHCKNWRWHMYVQDNDRRWEAVKAEMNKMHQARREMEQA